MFLFLDLKHSFDFQDFGATTPLSFLFSKIRKEKQTKKIKQKKEKKKEKRGAQIGQKNERNGGKKNCTVHREYFSFVDFNDIFLGSCLGGFFMCLLFFESDI